MTYKQKNALGYVVMISILMALIAGIVYYERTNPSPKKTGYVVTLAQDFCKEHNSTVKHIAFTHNKPRIIQCINDASSWVFQLPIKIEIKGD